MRILALATLLLTACYQFPIVGISVDGTDSFPTDMVITTDSAKQPPIESVDLSIPHPIPDLRSLPYCGDMQPSWCEGACFGNGCYCEPIFVRWGCSPPTP